MVGDAVPAAPSRPLVFLHGALGSREQVLPLAGMFGRDRQVVALDFSGHGRRADERGEFGIGRFAADLIGFLDADGIDRADIFGYSMGGYVALHAARHNPGRVGRIMTLGTKFAWDPATAEKEASRLDPAVMETKVPSFAARLRSLHGDAWTEVVRSTARMMMELGADPALDDSDFGSITNRVLLSVGDRDEMVSIEETVAVYRRLKEGSFLVLPGTGHPLDRIDPDLLAGRVKEYFSLIAAGATPGTQYMNIERP
jgi:pimeloyl-ACP methyl ester carboxylesterase